MIISVASGKGGTGKTTVATNLAVSIDDNVQILDCDVEAPNSHLFIQPDISFVDIISTPVPEVNMAQCILCKKCDSICRFSAIKVIGETILTFPELCHSCGGCIEVCPTKAISETYRELGTIKKGQKNNIYFINGQLRIGETMSPPLIREVRACVRSKIITIIDAPPGTSCPVIAAIKNTDFVILVTEPTPFGLYDLKLAVEAVKTLKITAGIVINRADIGNNLVKEYAESENLPILLEIPFDRNIAEAYSTGRLLVDAMPEWKTRFKQLYHQVEMITAKRKAFN